MFNENDKCFESKEPYENICGKVLKLNITKHSNSTEITISKGDESDFRIKCLFLSLVLLTGLIVTLYGLVSVNYFLLLLILVFVTAQRIFHTVKYEKLLYVPKLGCQISVKYSMGFSTKFIPAKSIHGIFINEVLSKHRVLFVLSVLVKDDSREFIIPLFTGTKPRLKCLEIIYQNLLD